MMQEYLHQRMFKALKSCSIYVLIIDTLYEKIHTCVFLLDNCGVFNLINHVHAMM